MVVFYNILGVIVALIAYQMYKLHSNIDKDISELRVAAKLLYTIFVLSSISIFISQFEPQINYEEFEILNPLLLLIFFLVAHGYIYTMLTILCKPKAVKIRYLTTIIIPTASLFALYTVCYIFFEDRSVYTLRELIDYMPVVPMLIFRVLLFIITIVTVFYGIMLYRKFSNEYSKQISGSVSSLELKQFMLMTKIQWSCESLAIWVLLTYFYTSPTLEVISCILITLILLYQYYGFRSFVNFKLSENLQMSVCNLDRVVCCAEDGNSYSDDISDNFSTMKERFIANEINPTYKNCEFLAIFNKLINEDKIFLQPSLRISEVASLMRTNRTYISLLIKEEYQCSFTDLMNRKRIDCSLELMRVNPSMKQSELAECSGFINAQTFSRVFKQVMGMPPKEWYKNEINR